MCHKHNAMKRHYFGPTLSCHADTQCQEAREKALLQYTQKVLSHVLLYSYSLFVQCGTLEQERNQWALCSWLVMNYMMSSLCRLLTPWRPFLNLSYTFGWALPDQVQPCPPANLLEPDQLVISNLT